MLLVYIFMNLHKKFKQINKAYDLSNNTVINIMIRHYLIAKGSVLENI